MKKLLIIAIFCVSLLSCTNGGDARTGVNSKEESSYVQTSSINREEIKEFEYKGHTYIYTRVRDGISTTHAGHCSICIKK